MRRLSMVLLCAIAAACSGSKSPRQLVILHTNDEHSHLLGFGPEADDYPQPTTAGSGVIKGGIARRAVLLKQERDAATAKGAASITVSAGDNMMGTLAQVAALSASPDFRLMKKIGYDVTTLGNHEFDYGPAALAGIIGTAVSKPEGAPVIVSSNIHFSGTSGDAALQSLFDESGSDTSKPIHRTFTMTTSNGIKIGFIGIMGADAAAVAPLKAPVTFSVVPGDNDSDRIGSLAQIYSDVQPLVTSLKRDQKVDLVIALSHGSADADHPENGEDWQIANHVEGIDVIVSGHSHTDVPAQIVTRANGRKTLVQQAGRFGDQVGRIALSIDENGQVIFDDKGSALLPVNDSIVPDADVSAFVTNVITSIEKTPVAGAGTPSFIGLSLLHAGVPSSALASKTNPGDLFKFPVAGMAFDLDNSGKFRETQLLDFVADAQLAYARSIDPGTQASLEAAGVVRVSKLEKGKASALGFGDVFRAVPLGVSPKTSTPGYPLCITNIYFAELKAAFELGAGYSYIANQNDLFVVPSGYKFEYDTTRPAFNPAAGTTSKDNGRVTKIYKLRGVDLVNGTYDAETSGNWDVVFNTVADQNDPPDVPGFPGWKVSPLTLVKIASNFYIAKFATFAGITLKDNSGNPIPGNDPLSTIVVRTQDGTDVKEWETVSAYSLALANMSGNTNHVILPKYRPDVALHRAICVGANASNGVCTH